MDNMNLEPIGWNSFFEEHFQPFAAAGLHPARVALECRRRYQIWSAQGEFSAVLSGRLHHAAVAPPDLPTVGDWVAIQSRPDKTIIHHVLPRRTKFSRTAAGRSGEEQILAANIDDVFIVHALDLTLNPRRIERYLTLAWQSGANPVVVLSKADLCPEPAAALAIVSAIAQGAQVHAVSSLAGTGLDTLARYLKPGRTIALLGPSGAGKSTIVNHWYGEEICPIQPVRESDHKGRHTTTQRELILLPSGALILDTPGLRELQLWEGQDGLAEVFADIQDLATSCRFSNCQHSTEPGCAVQLALQQGRLAPARFENYRKLKSELETFQRRQNRRGQPAPKRNWNSASLSTRDFENENE